MSVLKEILDWSADRPAWQRDALRRLVVTDGLEEGEILELAEICKATHGLADQPPVVVPLAAEHLANDSASGAAVSVESIFHQRGVNALAENQTLSFGRHLTVVYGDNAAGKTGYIRILKSACRARGQEQILGNVTAGTSPLAPVVAIKYRVGNQDDCREWAGQEPDEHISRVSVFDAKSAAVYLNEKTDVAFRPFGLDLFDRLVQACKGVKRQLEKERLSLTSNGLASLQALVADGTEVAKLLGSITSLTDPEVVNALARVSSEEEARATVLEQSLADLKVSDPEKLVRELKLKRGRLQAFGSHMAMVEAVLSSDVVETIFDVRSEGRRKSEEARNLRARALQSNALQGTGGDLWSALWEAARKFSTGTAYPSAAFPALEDGARCVLCQQDLDHAAQHRLRQFEEFVNSTAEQELRRIRHSFAQQRSEVADLDIRNQMVEETLEEIRIEDEKLGATLEGVLNIAEQRRSCVVHALTENSDLIEELPPLEKAAGLERSLVHAIDERIRTLRNEDASSEKQKLAAELEELQARQILAKHKDLVLREIDRKKKHAAYGLCIDDTRTQTITRKSTTVTRRVVTAQLKDSFQEELRRLNFRHVEVELQEVGGSEGVFYHKLVLSRAPGVELPRVVSEGEQRCLTIAAFFAELSTADNPSGIIFDDPVSSLDYRWREDVARRLVNEARERQVIVFTHDVVFLLLLKKLAQNLVVEQRDQHVRQMPTGAGVCTSELPWVALKVSKRIGYLKNRWQQAEKLHRDGHLDAYERDAREIYGYLREAWERGLEEILLNGVVERFRPIVETQRVVEISDITPEDCGGGAGDGEILCVD